MEFSTIHILVLLLTTTTVAEKLAIVKIASGYVEGVVSSITQPPLNQRRTVSVFKGIPYAQPPVGKLRFMKTVTPAIPWQGTRRAQQFGASCMQVALNNTIVKSMSEDCLFLNVYVPKNLTMVPGFDPLPVMIFFHGGSFTHGNADTFDQLFLLTIKNVIVVTINYRLGVFGFLGTGENTGTNSGLWDQRAAIMWVHNNIAAFGGDPAQVTLYGESAGATSVLLHIMSPLNNIQMFQRAIMQDGTTKSDLMGVGLPRERLRHTADLSRVMACENEASVMECLRVAPPNDLLIKATEIWQIIRPMKDDELITIDMSTLTSPSAIDAQENMRDFLMDLDYDVIIRSDARPQDYMASLGRRLLDDKTSDIPITMDTLWNNTWSKRQNFEKRNNDLMETYAAKALLAQRNKDAQYSIQPHSRHHQLTVT